MIKKIICTYMVLVVLGGSFLTPILAQNSLWNVSNDPIKILDAINKKANEGYAIQDTKLDGVRAEARYEKQYTLANTLFWVKDNINIYLQWLLYIGLAIATIALIYNGFLMVTNSVHNSGSLDKAKKNISKVLIGVVLLTGFLGIVKLMVALIDILFG